MSAHKSKRKKKCETVIRNKILDHSSLIQRQAKLFNPYYSIIWEVRNSFKSDRGKMKSYQNKRNKAVVLNYRQICTFLTSLVAQTVKRLPTIWETQVQSLGREDPLKWQPTPVLFPGESHGWKILLGYSPWGHKELDMTERLHFMHFLSPPKCTRDNIQRPFLLP